MSSRLTTEEDIEKYGNFTKLKKNKKKFFIARKGSTSGLARLEYYDSEKKFNSGGLAKRCIILKHCFAIFPKSDGKCKFGLFLCTKQDRFGIGYQTEAERDEWLNILKELKKNSDEDNTLTLPQYEHVWSVEVITKDLGKIKKVPPGQYHLCLINQEINLISLDKDQEISNFIIPLDSIRKCGNRSELFFVELGTSVPFGPGKVWLDVFDECIAQSMHATIYREMQNIVGAQIKPRRDSDFRGRSNTANPCRQRTLPQRTISMINSHSNISMRNDIIEEWKCGENVDENIEGNIHNHLLSQQIAEVEPNYLPMNVSTTETEYILPMPGKQINFFDTGSNSSMNSMISSGGSVPSTTPSFHSIQGILYGSSDHAYTDMSMSPPSETLSMHTPPTHLYSKMHMLHHNMHHLEEDALPKRANSVGSKAEAAENSGYLNMTINLRRRQQAHKDNASARTVPNYVHGPQDGDKSSSAPHLNDEEINTNLDANNDLLMELDFQHNSKLASHSPKDKLNKSKSLAAHDFIARLSLIKKPGRFNSTTTNTSFSEISSLQGRPRTSTICQDSLRPRVSSFGQNLDARPRAYTASKLKSSKDAFLFSLKKSYVDDGYVPMNPSSKRSSVFTSTSNVDETNEYMDMSPSIADDSKIDSESKSIKKQTDRLSNILSSEIRLLEHKTIKDQQICDKTKDKSNNIQKQSIDIPILEMQPQVGKYSDANSEYLFMSPPCTKITQSETDQEYMEMSAGDFRSQQKLILDNIARDSCELDAYMPMNFSVQESQKLEDSEYLNMIPGMQPVDVSNVFYDNNMLLNLKPNDPVNFGLIVTSCNSNNSSRRQSFYSIDRYIVDPKISNSNQNDIFNKQMNNRSSCSSINFGLDNVKNVMCNSTSMISSRLSGGRSIDLTNNSYENKDTKIGLKSLLPRSSVDQAFSSGHLRKRISIEEDDLCNDNYLSMDFGKKKDGSAKVVTNICGDTNTGSKGISLKTGINMKDEYILMGQKMPFSEEVIPLGNTSNIRDFAHSINLPSKSLAQGETMSSITSQMNATCINSTKIAHANIINSIPKYNISTCCAILYNSAKPIINSGLDSSTQVKETIVRTKDILNSAKKKEFFEDSPYVPWTSDGFSNINIITSLQNKPSSIIYTQNIPICSSLNPLKTTLTDNSLINVESDYAPMPYMNLPTTNKEGNIDSKNVNKDFTINRFISVNDSSNLNLMNIISPSNVNASIELKVKNDSILNFNDNSLVDNSSISDQMHKNISTDVINKANINNMLPYNNQLLDSLPSNNSTAKGRGKERVINHEYAELNFSKKSKKSKKK